MILRTAPRDHPLWLIATADIRNSNMGSSTKVMTKVMLLLVLKMTSRSFPYVYSTLADTLSLVGWHK